jgi:tetratricopeptide (TPR) repeat protein
MERSINMNTKSMLLSAEGCFASGLAAEQSGDLARAMQFYEQAIAIHPNYAPPYVNLGAVHSRNGNLDRAGEIFKRACEADPGYAFAFFNYGTVLDDLGMLEEAAINYRRAIALDTRYADPLFNLALICERKGQYRQALNCWSSFLALEKTGSFADNARNRVRKILDIYGLRIVSRTSHPKRNMSTRASLCLVK